MQIEGLLSGIFSTAANERGMWHPFHDLHRSEFLKTMKILKTQQVDRDILQERKHMELALVSDQSMVSLRCAVRARSLQVTRSRRLMDWDTSTLDPRSYGT